MYMKNKLVEYYKFWSDFMVNKIEEFISITIICKHTDNDYSDAYCVKKVFIMFFNMYGINLLDESIEL